MKVDKKFRASSLRLSFWGTYEGLEISSCERVNELVKKFASLIGKGGGGKRHDCWSRRIG